MQSKTSKIFLSAFAVAIVVTGAASALLLNIHQSVQSSPSILYRYVATFEHGYVTYPPPGFTSTHVNVYNPNSLNVTLTKQFVQAPAEPPQAPGSLTILGNTTKKVSFELGNGSAFEIDAFDVVTWPPGIFAGWNGSYPALRGFVIIESPKELNVTAVYSQSGEVGDIVDKITFVMYTPPSTIYVPQNYLFDVPYEVVTDAPPANTPTSVETLLVNAGVNDTYVQQGMFQILSITSYFDFQASPCRAREKIVFEIPNPNSNATGQEPQVFFSSHFSSQAPQGWVGYWPPPMPGWFKVGKTALEPRMDVVVTTSLNTISDTKQTVKDALVNQLVGVGIPLANAQQIVNDLRIEIFDVSVGEGIGAGLSMDVEIIPPAMVTVP